MNSPLPAATLGQQLQLWRLRHGLSLGGLALRSGVHKSTLSRWERDLQQPQVQEFTLLLSALNISDPERMACWRHFDTPRAALYRKDDTAALRSLGGGELLRALRLRAGIRQDDAARSVGVTRALLSRWERGERWPDSDKLQTLCYTLGASVDEMLYLTARGFVEAPSLPLQRTDVINMHYQLAYGSTTPQTPLFAWCLAARLGEINSKNLPQAQADQAAVWGTLSYDMGLLRGDLPIAAQYAQQTAGLMRASKRWLGTSQLQGILTLAAVERLRTGPLNAAHYLESWLDQILLGFVRAWLLSQQAGYLLEAGETDTALTLSRRAVQEAQGTGEERFRRRDFARHLIAAGQYSRALHELEWLTHSGVFSETENIPTQILIARALRGLGETSLAAALQQEACEQLTRQGLVLPREYFEESFF